MTPHSAGPLAVGAAHRPLPSPVGEEVAAAWQCGSCGGKDSRIGLADPVDYEYGVLPNRSFRFLQCATCGSEWLEPRPTEAELVSFYPDGYHAYGDDHGRFASLLVAMRARLRARLYGSRLPATGGWVFDVGAGDCRHFVELRRFLQFECAGVEINPAMAERARKGGYDVETGTLEGMDLGRHVGRYHIVSMNHVLEHVIDPADVLRRALTLLRPGGTLIGQIPTCSTWEHKVFGRTWAGYHYPRHLQIFSRSGLTRLVESTGFVNVRIKSTPHAQTALSVQNWLISRGARPRLRFGRAPFFSALLVCSLPIEILAACTDRSGVVDFEAERPGDDPAS